MCMNNAVKNDFFGFPKIKWLHLTGKVVVVVVSLIITLSTKGGQIYKIFMSNFLTI